MKEPFLWQPTHKDAKSEKESGELEIEAITRAVELDVFSLGVPIEEYGDPYSNVKQLIQALNDAGRSQDVVQIFRTYAPLSSTDVFGVPMDMFGDTEQLYRFTLEELVKNSRFSEADEIFADIRKHGFQNLKKAEASYGTTLGETDETAYMNDLRIDLGLAKIRYSTDRNLRAEEAGLVGDLIASIPEDKYAAITKALGYLKLAEAKHIAGLELEGELNEAERLIESLQEKDIDKFRRMAELVKVSFTVDADSERRLQLLLQCGYRALHSNDETGEMFKSMVEALSAMRGKKVDPHMQPMSPQLAVDVSGPLDEVICAIAKRGNAELAFQLAELELHEDWTRWEAYQVAIEGMPVGTVISPEIFQRIKELCREISLRPEMEKFTLLVTSLVRHGQSAFALELIDLTELEPNYKRELYGSVAEAIRRGGGNLESVLERLPEPWSFDELLQLGALDDAEKLFENSGTRERIRIGGSLIQAFIESGRDIKKVTNMVYRAMKDDMPVNDYDSEYDWLHAWAPRDLFIVLLRLQK